MRRRGFVEVTELLAVAAIVFLVLVLVAGVYSIYAHHTGIHNGKCISKDHQEEYTYWQDFGDGTNTVLIPQTAPESWSVTIEKYIDGVRHANSFSVVKEQWLRIEYGDWLVFEGDTLVQTTAEKPE